MSWLDVGGIISDYSVYPFKSIKLRPLTIGDLGVLDNAVRHRSIHTLVDLIQTHISVDVKTLRVIDFKYLLFWLKQKSFPDNSITVEWRCVNPVVHVEGFPKRIDKSGKLDTLNSASLHRMGYERSTCSRLNTEIVYMVRSSVEVIPTNFKLPKGYKFPIVQDLLDAEELLEDESLEHLVPYLMWIDSPLNDALEIFELMDGDIFETCANIDKFKALPYGTRINYKLKCGTCDHEYNIVKDPDLFSILPSLPGDKVMDLQYNLFGNFPGAVLDEDTPSMKLFYWHSRLVKDKQKQEEAEKKRQAQRGAMGNSLVNKNGR